MVLIKNDITEAITMLEELLMNCVEKETNICLHGNINGFIIRYSSVLDEYYIDPERLTLVCGWFEVDIKKEIVDISYSKEENSVHIIFAEGELYIDFDDFDSDLE